MSRDAAWLRRCTVEQFHRCRARVSGPLLDRIDLHLEVTRPNESMTNGTLSVISAGLSAPHRHWALNLARTIADLVEASKIRSMQFSEAIDSRTLDRDASQL